MQVAALTLCRALDDGDADVAAIRQCICVKHMTNVLLESYIYMHTHAGNGVDT